MKYPATSESGKKSANTIREVEKMHACEIGYEWMNARTEVSLVRFGLVLIRLNSIQLNIHIYITYQEMQQRSEVFPY